MSIFMGALGGVGEAMQSVGSTMLKSELNRETQSQGRVQESGLALQRAKALEEFKQSLQEAPLRRLGTKAQEFAGQEVPLEAKRVTSLPAYDSSDKTAPASFHGDIGIVQRAIANLPEPDRTAAMEQLRREVGQQQQVETQAVAGKTRKRTSDEALAAAADDAKVNDLPAYAQYEKDIGKPKRDERRIDVQQEREDNRATAAATSEERKAQADARRYDVELKRLELQAGTLEATNRKIDAWIENEATKRDNDEAKANNPKASSPERLYSIVNAMNATIKNLTEGGKGNTPEAKAEWQRQYETAVRVRDRASALLDANLGERGAPPAPAPGAPPAKPATSAASRPPLNSFLK